jgi:acetylornithine aminotransferase
LEIIEEQDLLSNALSVGNYLLKKLSAIPQLQNVRGRGLMIGFDVPDSLKDLKKILLTNFHVFTGEAKPNVIRLLPSLALTKEQADEFLVALKKAIAFIKES